MYVQYKAKSNTIDPERAESWVVFADKSLVVGVRGWLLGGWREVL